MILVIIYVTQETCYPDYVCRKITDKYAYRHDMVIIEPVWILNWTEV